MDPQPPRPDAATSAARKAKRDLLLNPTLSVMCPPLTFKYPPGSSTTGKRLSETTVRGSLASLPVPKTVLKPGGFSTGTIRPKLQATRSATANKPHEPVDPTQPGKAVTKKPKPPKPKPGLKRPASVSCVPTSPDTSATTATEQPKGPRVEAPPSLPSSPTTPIHSAAYTYSSDPPLINHTPATAIAEPKSPDRPTQPNPPQHQKKGEVPTGLCKPRPTETTISIPDFEKVTCKSAENNVIEIYYNYPYARVVGCSECTSTRHLHHTPGELDPVHVMDLATDLAKHIRTDHFHKVISTRWTVCRLCKATIEKPLGRNNQAENWWIDHLAKCHPNESLTYSREKSSGQFSCNICGIKFHATKPLETHECALTPIETTNAALSKTHATITTTAIAQSELKKMPEGFRCLFYRPDDPAPWIEKLYTDDVMYWALKRIGKHLEAYVLPPAIWNGTPNKRKCAADILPAITENKYTFFPICEHYHWKGILFKHENKTISATFIDPKQPSQTPPHILEAFEPINVAWKDNSYLYNTIPAQHHSDNTECGPLVCCLALAYEQIECSVPNPTWPSASDMRFALLSRYLEGGPSENPSQVPPTKQHVHIQHLMVPSALECLFLEKGLNAWFTDTAMAWCLKQLIPYPHAPVGLLAKALNGADSLNHLTSVIAQCGSLVIPHCINRMWCAVLIHKAQNRRTAVFLHLNKMDTPPEIKLLIESQLKAEFSPNTFAGTPPAASANDWQNSGLLLIHLILHFTTDPQSEPPPIPKVLKQTLQDTLIEKLARGSRGLSQLCEKPDSLLSTRSTIPSLLGLVHPKPDTTPSIPATARRAHSFNEMRRETSAWLSEQKRIYVDRGRKFFHFEWLVKQLALLISHATRDRPDKHAEARRTAPPRNPEANQTPYRPAKPKTIPPPKPPAASGIVTLYAASPSTAFKQIIEQPAPMCAIPPETLHNYFTGINNDPETNEDHIRALASVLPKMDIPSNFNNPFNIREVEALMKDTNKTSAAGNDGLTYKDWEDLDPTYETILFIVNECAHHELIPHRWKSSKCILIYKKHDPANPENWRPITLLPTIHKVYVGLWDARIATIPHLFSPEQRGFQADSRTGDNIFVLRTALDHARRNKANAAFAWVDIKNAFGSITHETIHIAIAQIGLPTKLANIARDMYAGCTTTYISEKGATKPVSLQVGTKQGDTISPTLFNLVLEILLRRHLARSAGFSYLDYTVKALAFADDLVLAANDKTTLERELNILALEAKVLNLEFKPEKCASLVLQCGKVNKSATVQILGHTIPTLTKNDHYPYLGIPMGHSSFFSIKEISDEIDQKARKINKSDLAVNQKLDCLKQFLLPKLTHVLSHGTPNLADLERLDVIINERLKDAANLPLTVLNHGYLYSPKEKGCLGFTSILDESRILAIVTLLKTLWHRDDNIRTLCKNYLVHHISQNRPGDTLSFAEALHELSSPTVHDGRGNCAPPNITRISIAIYHFTTASKLFQVFKIKLVNEEVILTLQESYSDKIVHIGQGQYNNCTKLIRKALKTAIFNQWMRQNKYKLSGRIIWVQSLNPESHHFIYNKPPHLSCADQKFIHFARLNLTELAADTYRHMTNMRREPDRDEACRRCTAPDGISTYKESLGHVLNMCAAHLNREITDRHNSIQNLLIQAWELGDKAHYSLTVAKRVIGTGTVLLPDITIRGKPTGSDIEEVIIVDVRCRFEKHTKILDEGHAEKTAKYQPLADTLNKNDKTSAKVYSLIMGSLGSFRMGNYDTFRAMGIPDHIQLTLAKLMSNTAISWSRYIYWKHIYGSEYLLFPAHKLPVTPVLKEYVPKGPTTDPESIPPTKKHKGN